MVAGLPRGRQVLFFFLSVYLFILVLHASTTVSESEGVVSTPSILVRQSGYSWEITPLSATQSPSDFYGYRDFRAGNPRVEGNTSLIFFYRDVRETPFDTLNLFAIHGPPSIGASESTASFALWGLPATAFALVKDDPDDYYALSPPSGNISWRWSAGLTDGVVLGGLRGEFTLTLYPRFDGELRKWVLLSGDLQNPQYIVFPSMQNPLTLEVRWPSPIARFEHHPSEPLAGETVTFDASPSGSSTGPITQYRWDFNGDGAFDARSTAPVFRHIFLTPGDHAVTLEVEDSQGRHATQTRTLRVRQDVVHATRVLKLPLPDSQILRGYSFQVELWIEAEVTVNGLGIAETAPAGWRIQPLDNDGAHYNAETSEWLFLETLPAGERRRIRYRIDVPPQEQPGTYRFMGRTLVGLPQLSTVIRGDSEVRVLSALSIELAISHLNEQGELDLTLPPVISFSQILQATALWQEQKPVPGTNGRRIDLHMMVRLVAYWLTDTPVNQSLPAGSP
jgi:PKD repeat protein